MRKKIILIALLLLLLILSFRIYKILMPSAPNIEPVTNEVRDRGTQDWGNLENQIPKNSLKEAYFGDLHVHTKFSFDAYIGGVSAGPEEAYSFAKGKEIDVLERRVKITKPLDFAAVTDHSEFLGEMYSTQTKGVKGHYSLGSIMLRGLGNDTMKQRKFFNRMRKGNGDTRTHPNFFSGYHTTSIAWDKILAAAENHYEPGSFTTFAAYEWTLSNSGAHLHRNIVFKDMNVPDYPISAFEARDAKQLWASLEGFRSMGSTVMAIPHNTNLSHGYSFDEYGENGIKLTAEDYRVQQKNEPLVEIHQAKGNSEVHPKIWTEDEYADFEIYEEDSIPKATSFIRYALKKGLEYKKEFGVNPYEYGLISSTDTHNGTPGNTEESDEYQGNHLFVDTDPVQRSSSQWVLNDNLRTAEAINPGGLVGVWARANTRPEIYESMKQREVFGTSGSRITLRLFGGQDFKKSYDDYESMVSDGYEFGVPMGQYLKKVEGSPQFIVWASKDPEGANLERIQIIKGWYENEELQEEIYDVVITDRLYDEIDEAVNMNSGEQNDNYGSSELSGVWTDQKFSTESETFYYLRVIEVPSLRYTQWDVIRYGTIYPDDIKKTIQERAWSSPIWYSPSN